MLKNKLNLKILTSIFIVLFFIVFFNSSSYAVTTSDSLQPIIDYLDNDTTFQDTLNNYSYCLLFNQNNNYFYNNSYYVYMTNTSPLNFIGTDNGSSYTLSDSSNTDLYKLSLIYYRDGSFRNFGYSNGSGAFGFNITDSLEATIPNITYVYKGNLGISFNGTSIIEPVSTYDFSFVINDHNFDFYMEDQTFLNGVTLSSDDVKNGHYFITIKNFTDNVYYNDDHFYFVTGYLDFIPDYNSSSQCFYFSSGYENIRIYNEDNEPLNYYRFSFSGISSDSDIPDTLLNLYDNNKILSSVYGSYDKYSTSGDTTIAYSNHDIYYAIDTSLYGFDRLTSVLFYDTSSYDDIIISNPMINDYSSNQDRSLNDDVSIFSVNNNVYNYPSSNPYITTGATYSYSGDPIEVTPFNFSSNPLGTTPTAIDTSNYTILDYVKTIPTILTNLPLTGITGAYKVIVPSFSDFQDMYLAWQEFAQAHLGVLNFPLSYIMNFLGNIREKYTDTFSHYYFYIPGIRWYNPAIGEKQTLVESTTIDLNTYFINDEDMLHFWGTLRYLVSFLIYLNLIIMLFNKYKGIIGGDRAKIVPYNAVGDISMKGGRKSYDN